MEVVMDLLITVIGNAVVHEGFREKLFDDPIDAINTWGFHLTKGDLELLIDIFGEKRRKQTEQKKEPPPESILHKCFVNLETEIYEKIAEGQKAVSGVTTKTMPVTPTCGKPCRLSVGPLKATWPDQGPTQDERAA
jgi:hypothetical protein